MSIEDITHYLEDNISRADAHMLLSHKVSLEELKPMLDAKLNTREVETELYTMSCRLDEL